MIALMRVLNKLIPNLTLVQMRADDHSDNPVFLARRERFPAGMKLAGMPEN